MDNLSIMTIGGVECYEKDGIAYLKLENVARGLGFTQTQVKNGVEYTSIRWETVRRYLAGFGFPSEMGKDDFIPENAFYRLAMKANNETAEQFQALVADEIIPSIRKTGGYQMQKPMTQLEIIAAQAQALVDHERRMNAIEDSVKTMDNKLTGVVDTFKTPLSESDAWQEETRRTVTKLVQDNKLSYQAYWSDLYERLEVRAGVNLETRKKRLKERLAKQGASKRVIENVSKLLVISRDKKLVEIFNNILREEKAKYVLLSGGQTA